MEEDVTKEEIIRINRKIVEDFGEVFGVLNEGNLDFLIAKTKNTKDVFRKSAELLHGIAKGHPFLDGNKRTAFEVARIVLLRNNLKLAVSPIEGESFMLDVVVSESLTVKETEIWIRGHSGANEEE